MTDSEQFWNDRFDEALEAWRDQGVFDDESQVPSDDPNATVNFDPHAKEIVYPNETLNDSVLQAATFVEEHIKSLCK